MIRNKVARPSGYSTSKNKRLVNKSPTCNQVPGECDVHNNHGLVISNMHQGDSFYNDDNAFLNERFRDLISKVGGNIDSGEYVSNYVKFTYKFHIHDICDIQPCSNF